MKTSYMFSTLRYIYDPVTLEFVNVGVVVYSQETRLMRARCTTQYGRISELFESFDGVRLRQTLRFLQDRINDLAEGMAEQLQFGPARPLHEVLGTVLPIDDSSLQFVQGGVGLTEDLVGTTESLFLRYVERYADGHVVPRRADEDVWRSFRQSFDRKEVTSRLLPKRIVAPNYEYEFQRSWKNGVWNLLEPVSFDLSDASLITEKANRWVGRAMGLEDSAEEFKLFLLLGAPGDERLRAAYRKAENLLHKMPVAHEFVEEADAEDFARTVAGEMQKSSVVA